MKKIVVLTGAGISKESGIDTFRDSKDGLWNKHKIEDVCTPAAWNKNPKKVLEFYNERRSLLKDIQPNSAHYDLVRLEEKYIVTIITQNVDDLHERAGSSKIIHLHGELTKGRGTDHYRRKAGIDLIFDIGYNDINYGDLDADGCQIRPHIVWFGENVPMLEQAVAYLKDADIVILIGTSLQVYPAAGLIEICDDHIEKYYIDPEPSESNVKYLQIIKEKATIGVKLIVNKLLEK
jgi:NAD-dependent deacetylase